MQASTAPHTKYWNGGCQPAGPPKNGVEYMLHKDRFRYLDLGFGGEQAGVSVRATIDHMQGIQFEKRVHPQPKNNKNPEIDPTHMLSVALNSSGSRSWTFATRLLCSAL